MLGCKNELLFERREEGNVEELGMAKGLEEMVCRGPYSHVTSQSLSLYRLHVRKCDSGEGWVVEGRETRDKHTNSTSPD